LIVGVKGAVTAVTKTGKLIKIGRTASGMGKVIPVDFRPGLLPVATSGSSALALEAAPQMIIENVEEASKALGILRTTLMQAGKAVGSGAVAGGGGSNLSHDIGSTSTTEPQSSTSGGSSEPSIQEKEHMIGENGPRIDSKSINDGLAGNERIDVENPVPGKAEGRIHYHEHDNTKWIYDIRKKIFLNYQTQAVAPPRIQKNLERPEIQRAIKKALHFLGEE